MALEQHVALSYAGAGTLPLHQAADSRAFKHEDWQLIRIPDSCRKEVLDYQG